MPFEQKGTIGRAYLRPVYQDDWGIYRAGETSLFCLPKVIPENYPSFVGILCDANGDEIMPNKIYQPGSQEKFPMLDEPVADISPKPGKRFG